jgi:uncharacterized protein (DUF305 family)
MQINIDKKTGSLIAIIIVLLATIFGISLKRDGNDGSHGMHHNGSKGKQEKSASTAFSGADVMFLQMMIPHHQQAIDISNIALKSSKDVELLALADTIIEAQTAEIVQMSSWLKEAGASMDMGHSMSGMGGMLDEAELSTLAVAKGKEFDALWLKGMIEHHDGAIDMSSMIADASNPEIKAFGENVIKDQSAQIDQMNAMLKRIS